MIHNVDEAADKFYDKWLPAFSEPMLGYAERFHKEITATLIEARTAGIKAAEKVVEEWVADIGGRLMEGKGSRPLLEGGASAASCILTEIRALVTKDLVGDSLRVPQDATSGMSKIFGAMPDLPDPSAAPERVYLSGQRWGASSGGKPCGHHKTNPCGCPPTAKEKCQRCAGEGTVSEGGTGGYCPRCGGTGEEPKS